MKSFVTEAHRLDCVKTIQRLIAIPSVLNEGENGTPFGVAIQEALEETLRICDGLGFQTYIDPEGYYGYAEIGQGEELLAILCHLDVVPAGDLPKWDTPAFEGVIKDGYLIGRGSQDDKGPSIATLYAVKALRDAGVDFGKRVRFIFGTDEETLWRCLQRYNQLEETATMGFAPDSSFPLTFAEKGLLQVKLHGQGNAALALELGQAFNVVPGKATYRGSLVEQVKAKLTCLGYDYENSDDSVTVLGLARHSKDAAQGINAIVRLLEAISEFSEDRAIDFILEQIGHDTTGSTLFGLVEDEPTGKLSFNLAGLTMTPDKTEIRLDLRIPVLADKVALVQKLTEVAATYGLVYEEYDYLAPLYVPLDSPLVETLMTVYRDMTGEMTEPIASGGATFARTMPNCVAFGACFPDAVQTEHQENERIVLDDLYKAMDIYAEAIYRLLQL